MPGVAENAVQNSGVRLLLSAIFLQDLQQESDMAAKKSAGTSKRVAKEAGHLLKTSKSKVVRSVAGAALRERQNKKK